VNLNKFFLSCLSSSYSISAYYYEWKGNGFQGANVRGSQCHPQGITSLNILNYVLDDVTDKYSWDFSSHYLYCLLSTLHTLHYGKK